MVFSIFDFRAPFAVARSESGSSDEDFAAWLSAFGLLLDSRPALM